MTHIFISQTVTIPWKVQSVSQNRRRGKETQPLVIRDRSHPVLLTWFLSRAPRWQRSPPLPQCAHGSSSEPGRESADFWLEKKRRSHLVPLVKQGLLVKCSSYSTTISVSKCHCIITVVVWCCQTLLRMESFSKCVKCGQFVNEKQTHDYTSCVLCKKTNSISIIITLKGG